jgi:hypothetical protein
LLPTHEPDWHESDCVHASPSLHVVPSLAAGFEQRPVPVSQVPATWHWSMAAQTTAVPPAQAPAWQVSATVQALPSVQPEPSAFDGLEQDPVSGSHDPARWH